MSLLDRGPHSVVVTPRTKTKNAYGEWDLGAGTPVTVSGVMVQPVTVEEHAALGGSQAVTLRKVIGRGPWPGGVHSTVSFEGRTWDQIGEHRSYTIGRRTNHFDVVIQARSAEVK